MSKIRVFVGSEKKTKVMLLVLKRSIEARASVPVEVIEMGDFSPWVVPKDVHQATGFSLRRFMIPEECNFEGRAIYLDADMLLLSDIKELWDYGDNGATVCCTYRCDKSSKRLAGNDKAKVPQSSVMVINTDCCDPSEWSRKAIFDRIRKAGKPHSGNRVVQCYQETLHIMHPDMMKELPVEIPLEWNDFNNVDNKTKLFHDTYEKKQAYINLTNPLRWYWEQELFFAIKEGYVTKDILEEALWYGKHGPKDFRDKTGMDQYYSRYLPLCS